MTPVLRTTVSTASLNGSRGRLNSTNGPVNDALNLTLPGRVPNSVNGESGVDDDDNDTDVLLHGNASGAAVIAGAGAQGIVEPDSDVRAAPSMDMDTDGEGDVADILARNGFDDLDQSSSSHL